MDLIRPYRPDHLTPAKLKAEESAAAAATEYDFLPKKLKVGETHVAMEDDRPPELKSKDDFLSKHQKEGETSVVSEDDLPSKEDLVKELPGAFSDAPGNLRAEDLFPPVDDIVFRDENARRCYELHVEEFTKSEGFDLYHFCNKLFGAVMPLALTEDDPFFVNDVVFTDCQKSVEAAIEYYNKKEGCSLKFVEIIKCFFATASGTCYYTTFDAMDTRTQVTRTYQTKLFQNHRTGKTTIIKFRLRHLNPYSHA